MTLEACYQPSVRRRARRVESPAGRRRSGELLRLKTQLMSTLQYSSRTQREDEHEREHKHGTVRRVFQGCPDLKVTSVSSTLQTAAKQQQQRWRRRRRSAPLSVVQFGRVHRLLVLVVLRPDQPLAGKVFKDDVIVAEGDGGEGGGVNSKTLQAKSKTGNES